MQSVGGERGLVVKWFAYAHILGLWQLRDWNWRPWFLSKGPKTVTNKPGFPQLSLLT